MYVEREREAEDLKKFNNLLEVVEVFVFTLIKNLS